jgi:threonylcarbamoyladenosine tRNA methylthiotransferase MtaB
LIRVGFHTFGCKLNQSETDAIASVFPGDSFSVVPADQDADAYIINTCTVTSRADHKARAFIRGLARSHPRSLLIVTGCAAQVETEALASLGENVTVVPQAEKSRLLRLPQALAEAAARAHCGQPDQGHRANRVTLPEAPGDVFALTTHGYAFRDRAYLKVQDGCDSWCSYCRVPRARGPSVSLHPDEVVRRASELEGQGYREIVVTGVNISSYCAAETSLPGLLRRILDCAPRARIRLSSLEPESVTADLAEVLSHPRVCAHFHIPVQSGSNRVLALMRRRYRSDCVRKAVSRLRGAKADPFLAADLIVGFPGESAADFEETRRMAEDLSFATLHVFPFSPRPGTPAASFEPAVPERTRFERARTLIGLSRKLASDYSRMWVGRDVQVVIEGGDSSSIWGVSGNYLKVRVNGAQQAGEARGRLAEVRIVSADGGHSRARFLRFRD